MLRIRRMLPVRMETHTTLRLKVARPPMPPQQWLSKEKEAEKHREEVDMAPVGTLIAYSDGLKDTKGNTGTGWVTTTNRATLETGHIALGKWMEVADIEVYRACEATLNMWKSKDDRRRIQVLWVPGHVGLEENEQADAQAKLGCLRSNLEPHASLAGAQRWGRNQLREEYKKWWKEQEGYRPLDGIPCNPPFRVLGYKGLDRTELGHILAARMGHGDFDQYHDCFNHQCPRKCTHCNQPKE
ncbi:endonuclease/reverse transcriptase [Ceratocystis lukuohia]|uniref:Endonuclease/reverse transcriptase n=1 Tax=Ceratocystis lukuohia TaxID=2019550 RepID=A0ABR4M8L3_9PEZI